MKITQDLADDIADEIMCPSATATFQALIIDCHDELRHSPSQSPNKERFTEVARMVFDRASARFKHYQGPENWKVLEAAMMLLQQAIGNKMESRQAIKCALHTIEKY